MAESKAVAAVETVKMLDGRLVDFPGKRKLQKESFITADGAVSVRLDFRNGETRTVTLRPDMIPKYAAHGAEQKLGDEIAGLKGENGAEADIDDCVLAIDELTDRLNAGEWGVKRESNGMAGTSVLLRAIVQVTGKSVDAVKSFLKDKSKAQKDALRVSPKFAAAVKAIESERAAKKPPVDTADLEAQLDSI